MRRAILALLLAAVPPAPAVPAAEPYQSLARTLVGQDQPVFVETEDGSVLAAQAETRPVHPASVSKVATTLALLERLGPDHRFLTRVSAAGPRPDGRVPGDLRVDAGGDPFFVSEHAFGILLRLHRAGIRGVDGRLAVRGPLFFNWKPDPDGERLRAALAGRADQDAWERALPPHPGVALADAALAFDGRTAAAGSADEGGGAVLAVHRSPSLREIVKALNGYSNNVFHPLSGAIGGPHAVEAAARASVPEAMRAEIRIDNGAGAGETNRLSARAAVAILAALERELVRHGLDLPDTLPVSGLDPGTLHDRFLGPGERGTVAGKTGTYGDVGASALVGVLRTRRHGRVRFAILNAWLPVPEARRRQDAFVRALIEVAHAEPWPYTPAATPPVAAAALE